MIIKSIFIGLFFFSLSIVSMFFGRKIVKYEIENAGSNGADKVMSFWNVFCIVCAAVFSILSALAYLRVINIEFRKLFILYYVIHISLGFSIVEIMTGNFYMESLVYLLPFILFGLHLNGKVETFFGFIAGICYALTISLVEYMLGVTVSLDGSSVILGVFCTSLLGYSYVGRFYTAIAISAVILILGYRLILHRTSVTLDGRKNLNIPMLPCFSGAAIMSLAMKMF